MTRTSKSERAPVQRFKPLVVDVTHDENFNWLHSRRTPAEKKRDEEIAMRFKERMEQLGREEQVRGESEDLSKSNRAAGCNEERSNGS